MTENEIDLNAALDDYDNNLAAPRLAYLTARSLAHSGHDQDLVIAYDKYADAVEDARGAFKGDIDVAVGGYETDMGEARTARQTGMQAAQDAFDVELDRITFDVLITAQDEARVAFIQTIDDNRRGSTAQGGTDGYLRQSATAWLNHVDREWQAQDTLAEKDREAQASFQQSLMDANADAADAEADARNTRDDAIAPAFNQLAGDLGDANGTLMTKAAQHYPWVGKPEAGEPGWLPTIDVGEFNQAKKDYKIAELTAYIAYFEAVRDHTGTYAEAVRVAAIERTKDEATTAEQKKEDHARDWKTFDEELADADYEFSTTLAQAGKDLAVADSEASKVHANTVAEKAKKFNEDRADATKTQTDAELTAQYDFGILAAEHEETLTIAKADAGLTYSQALSDASDARLFDLPAAEDARRLALDLADVQWAPQLQAQGALLGIKLMAAERHAKTLFGGAIEQLDNDIAVAQLGLQSDLETAAGTSISGLAPAVTTLVQLEADARAAWSTLHTAAMVDWHDDVAAARVGAVAGWATTEGTNWAARVSSEAAARGDLQSSEAPEQATLQDKLGQSASDLAVSLQQEATDLALAELAAGGDLAAGTLQADLVFRMGTNLDYTTGLLAETKNFVNLEQDAADALDVALSQNVLDDLIARLADADIWRQQAEALGALVMGQMTSATAHLKSSDDGFLDAVKQLAAKERALADFYTGRNQAIGQAYADAKHDKTDAWAAADRQQVIDSQVQRHQRLSDKVEQQRGFAESSADRRRTRAKAKAGTWLDRVLATKQTIIDRAKQIAEDRSVGFVNNAKQPFVDLLTALEAEKLADEAKDPSQFAGIGPTTLPRGAWEIIQDSFQLYLDVQVYLHVGLPKALYQSYLNISEDLGEYIGNGYYAFSHLGESLADHREAKARETERLGSDIDASIGAFMNTYRADANITFALKTLAEFNFTWLAGGADFIAVGGMSTSLLSRGALQRTAHLSNGLSQVARQRQFVNSMEKCIATTTFPVQRQLELLVCRVGCAFLRRRLEFLVLRILCRVVASTLTGGCDGHRRSGTEALEIAGGRRDASDDSKEDRHGREDGSEVSLLPNRFPRRRKQNALGGRGPIRLPKSGRKFSSCLKTSRDFGPSRYSTGCRTNIRVSFSTHNGARSSDGFVTGVGNGVVKLGLGHFSLFGEGWGNSENSSPQDERG